MSKLNQAISPHSARRIYDLIGRRYDWFGGYEARAKQRSLELLELAPGMRVLEVGVGTGKQHGLLEEKVAPGGSAFGMDLSPVMLGITRLRGPARQRSRAPLCQADARRLPFATASLERVYATYVLDLMPQSDLLPILAEFRRVLEDGARCVVAALTEGVNLRSRLLMAAWKAFYTLSPYSLGGCRPVQLAASFEQAGFKQVRREVVVQLAMPSEIIVAMR